MAMRSNFIIAAALLSLARTEDQVDVQLQRYLEMRRHVAAFDDALGTKAEMQNGVVIGDLMGKLATLLVFDFEGAVVLKAWEDLGGIVRKGGVCRDVGMLKAMGDCLLRSRAPGKGMFIPALVSLFSSPSPSISRTPSFSQVSFVTHWQTQFQGRYN